MPLDTITALTAAAVKLIVAIAAALVATNVVPGSTDGLATLMSLYALAAGSRDVTAAMNKPATSNHRP